MTNSCLPSPSAETRLCESCLLPKPLTDFRLRRRGGVDRFRQCRGCHNAAERTRLQAQRDRKLGQQLGEIAGAQSNRRVVVLANLMVNRLGGMTGFVAEWERFYRQSKEIDQMRCLKAVLSLVRVSDSLR